MKSVNKKHTNCGKCIFHGVINALRLTCNNQEVRKRFIDDLDGYCKHFKEDNMNKQQFLEAFADNMIRSTLALAYDVLESGISYFGGSATLNISETVPHRDDSTISVSSRSQWIYGPDDSPGEYEADGCITWETTSSHVVKFNFGKREAHDRNEWLELDSVTIGCDKSKRFYPGIVSACESAGIPVEIEK